MNGDVRDNVAAGVLEPTMSKVRSLKSAYEAAISLLRIDDAIQCIPGKELSLHRGDFVADWNRTKAGSRCTWSLNKDSVLRVIHRFIMLMLQIVEKFEYMR